MFGWLIGLPLAPVRLVIRMGQLIQEQAEHELRDPAAVRRRLEAIEEARSAGEISAEEEEQAIDEVLRLMSGTRGG
ncbi:hypothetical protein TBS_15430 [Thermobispora bispora]|jgi:uncharacterized membrane protein|uniref:Gas vesicle protein G n=1 Tax=Thermobispora bispora (strain ATCC 19993 / DSM 43833 / CBS 139.67 / JCM 10125 / KCTC 9307 / NBRC 14880 / R51) TaxID=469371 RepID=D6Y9P3_THEBD|nr:gas vesicle protein GvpG [Thermobispora bispora]MBO2473126.1 gas vesicle protein G [Actinomycetales bacterium]MDI9581305.1 gas vesicle protein GvpG [Thermobispora sp.]ADG90074.1 hypothetical protein Tbis_3384 [Thermobispora bispora DSM 43833]MBX6169087.1 gas vesicle protein GvpG [Thermobispora bispora]QSI46525.1 gas vesicle protein G [Thermobispora bispora]